MNIKNKIIEFKPISIDRWEFFQYWALLLAFSGGLFLSAISALGLCTSECSGTKSYLLFGFPFAYVGLVFFSVATLLQLFSTKYPLFRSLLMAMVAGSLGSETMFIWIQKYQLGSWCPICLSIFATLGLSGIIYLGGFIIQFQQGSQLMKAFKNSLCSVPLFLIGFLVAFVGISKPDHQLIAMNSIKEKIAFGDVKSPVEVYFISDWFCSACKKVEPVIQKSSPAIMKQASFFFIDHAVNPDTANYSPYNLDFLVHNKTNYFKIREALIHLAKKDKSPDDAAINKMLAPLGEKLKELSYGDIKAGLYFFDEISKKYNVHSTPTLVIVNTKTHEVRQFKGSEITESHILEAIQDLKKNKS